MDCFLIPFCLWDTPKQIEQAMEWVSETVRIHGYSAKHNLGELQKLVRDLSLEVEEQTVKKDWIDKVEFEITKIGGIDYYSFEDKGSTHYLNKSEFEKAKSGISRDRYSKPIVKLFDDKGIERESKLLSEVIQSSMPHKYKLVDTYTYYSNSSNYTFELKTKTTKVEKITKIRPQVRLINSWEGEIRALTDKINDTIISVKEQRDDMTSIREHFFVPNDFRKIVETNIVDVLKSLDVLKRDLGKIRQKWLIP